MNYIANNFNHEVKTHKDYTDVSFYEDNSKIKKIGFISQDSKKSLKKTVEHIFLKI